MWRRLCILISAVLCVAACEDSPTDPADETFAVTVTAEGNGTAVAEPEEAAAGETVTVTASPGEEYEFSGWVVTSGNLQLDDATANPLTFVMPSAAVSIKAVFIEEAEETYPISVTATEGGNVDYGARFPSSPADLIQRPEAIPAGSTVLLTAEAGDGYRFKEWNVTKGDTGEIKSESGGGYSFVMPAEEVAIEAVFEISYYRLTVDGGIENGDVTVDVDAELPNVREGAIVELEAVPDEGYKFMGWDIDGVDVGADDIKSSPFLFRMPGNDVIISARFSPPTDDVSAEIEDPGFREYVRWCMSNEQTITVNDLWYDETKTFSDEGWVKATPVTETYPKWDTDGDGKLSEAEAAAVKAIDVSKEALATLGLTTAVKSIAAKDYLYGVELIQASGQDMEEINADEFPALRTLVCNYSGLRRLSIDKCAALEKLFVEHNQLTELNLGKNKALYSLSCWDNHIIAPAVIDISAMAVKDGRFLLRFGSQRPSGMEEYRELEDLPVLQREDGESEDAYHDRVNAVYGSVLAIMSLNKQINHWSDVSDPESVELIYVRNVGWVGW